MSLPTKEEREAMILKATEEKIAKMKEAREQAIAEEIIRNKLIEEAEKKELARCKLLIDERVSGAIRNLKTKVEIYLNKIDYSEYSKGYLYSTFDKNLEDYCKAAGYTAKIGYCHETYTDIHYESGHESTGHHYYKAINISWE